MSATVTSTNNTIATMPLTRRGLWIVAVSSMEQVIGAAISTVVGVILPMLQLTLHPEMSSPVQGLIGATGLIGICVGSAIIGKLSDKQGYLQWFRICPILIMVGAILCWLFPHRAMLILGLFLAGIGTGGGYSLDSAYISELLPERWRLRMVGAAKASCAIGFIGAAVICWFIIRGDANPSIWHDLILIVGVAAAATLLMRLRWAESPKWLMAHGREEDARKALAVFFGENSGIVPAPVEVNSTPECAPSWGSMFRGENLKRVIFSGIPWACEGLGVYGFGVFLPALVITLGIESSTAVGIAKIANSVEVTAIVNFFILPGFIIGLLIMNKINHVKMLTWGFIGSAIGLGMLLVGYLLHLPKWEMILGFIIFEITLNCGPHLITFIIPSKVYPVAERGTGSGIAAMIGKLGAILGVVLMPILIDLGGGRLVLIVSIAVMLLGAFISTVYGRQLQLTTKN